MLCACPRLQRGPASQGICNWQLPRCSTFCLTLFRHLPLQPRGRRLPEAQPAAELHAAAHFAGGLHLPSRKAAQVGTLREAWAPGAPRRRHWAAPPWLPSGRAAERRAASQPCQRRRPMLPPAAPCLSTVRSDGLRNLIARMLVVDPSKRATLKASGAGALRHGRAQRLPPATACLPRTQQPPRCVLRRRPGQVAACIGWPSCGACRHDVLPGKPCRRSWCTPGLPRASTRAPWPSTTNAWR